MNVISGCNDAWSSQSLHNSLNRQSKKWIIAAFLLLLALVLGAGNPAAAQTASYSGVMTAIDTTHFSGPQGIATDTSGNVFIADDGTETVYEMTRTGPSAYSAPVALPKPAGGYVLLRGIAIDSNGNLWVADFANYPTTHGQVYESVYNSVSQTFATPVAVGASWQAPWAITADTSGHVFATDNSASTISEISAGVVTVVNTGGILNPRGIAVDSGENLYIVNGNTFRVMKLVPPYTAAPIAANSTQFSGAGDLALDASGNIWIAEYGTNLIRELTVSSKYATILSWGSGLNGPLAVWPDADRAMLVSDYNNHAIKQITVQGMNLGTFALGSVSGNQTIAFTFTGASPTTIQKPIVVTQGATGKDFVDAGTGTCTTTNGTGNPYSTNAQCTVVLNFQPKAPGIRYGAVDLLDTSGNLLAEGLFYGTGTGPQLVFNPGKATTPVIGFNVPQKIAVDGSGDVFVVDSGASRIYKIPAGGSSATAIATAHSFSAPYGIAIDGAGNLFVTESGANQIDEITASSGYTTVNILTPKFGGPLGLAVDADGNLYIADASSTHAVEEMTAISGYSVVRTLSSSFTKPFGVAVDASGNVFVADEGSTAITELVAVNGQVPTAPTTHSYGTFTSPAAVAVDSAGNVYVADNGGGTISELTAASSYASSMSLATKVASPAGIAVDGNGNVHYTTNGTDNSVYELALSAPPTLAFLSSPYKTPSTDSPKSVTISNIGSGSGSSSDLNFSALAVTTTTVNAANSFSQVAGTGTPADCSATSILTGGGSCNLSISFTPQAVVAIVGTATLTDNTLSVPGTAQTITLSGTGTQATPLITWSTPAAISYGTALSATQLNASSAVAGTFVYTPAAGTVLTAGTQTLSVTFTPTDAIDYTSATQTVQITVTQATPVIAWSTPAAISYGTALSATQLNASSTVAGTFAYTPAAATVLTAGTQTLSVTFTPTDVTDYTSVTQTVQITVNQATPTIAWSTPVAITYGTALSATQLNATSTVAGTFAYTPAAGTVLAAGTHTLSVTLTPTDATDYTTATQTVQLVVNQAAAPTITWPTPAAITYGTALSAAQLDASTTIAGSFVYSPAAGTVPQAGTQILSVTFNPTDSTDYPSATQTVQLVVNKATPAVTWAAPAAIPYGTALGATQLNASSNVAGTFVYTPAAGTVLNVGTHALSVTLTPTDATDYNQASQTVSLTVNQAVQTITFAPPASVAYGSAPITLTATGGGSGNPVTFTLASGPASLAGSTLTVTGVGTVVVDANQAGNSNYLAATQVSKSISVMNGVLTVSANNASRVYGAANPTFTGSVTGAVNGDTFAETFSSTATATSPVGTYPIVPAVTGSNLAAYTVNTQDGTLTVTKASSTTTLTLGSSSIGSGQSVTFTATVASSTTGTPTGSVSFFNGSTLLGTGALASGTATYTTTTLPSGSDSITATYGGDTNFTTSSTTAGQTIVVGTLDFTFAASGPTDQIVKGGASATYQFTLNPTLGNYPSAVTFTATGLPAGATIAFSPSSVAVTGGKQSVTATVATAPAVGSNAAPAIGRSLAPLGLALILLPLVGARRMRRYGRGMSGLLSLLLLLGGLVTVAAVSGCGGSSSKTTPQNYLITVTATGGNVQHSADVTLEVN